MSTPTILLEPDPDWGNPVFIKREWLTDDVIAMEAQCKSNSFRDLTEWSILADALEEAGCDVPELLGYLRSNGAWTGTSMVGLAAWCELGNAVRRVEAERYAARRRELGADEITKEAFRSPMKFEFTVKEPRQIIHGISG